MTALTFNPATYGRDLSYIQDRSFSEFSEKVARHVVRRLRESPRHVETVVDVGCGAGNSTRILTEAGFSVIAIEPSAALLEIAQRKAPEASFLCVSAYDVELPSCDAVIAVGEPLTYHEPSSDALSCLHRFLRNVHTALSPGGMLIFDLIVSGQESLDRKTWSAGDDWAMLVQNAEDHESWLTREITTFRKKFVGYRRRHERHFVKIFDEGEVTALLRFTGFDVTVDSRYGSIELLTRRRAFFGTRRL